MQIICKWATIIEIRIINSREIIYILIYISYFLKFIKGEMNEKNFIGRRQ